jgi:pilus assembly protein CpaB
MNRRLATILLVALLITGVSALLVGKAVSSRIAQKPIPTTSVVAAAADIKLGAILSDTNLTTMQIVGSVPKGVILDKDKKSLIGRGVISELYAGEPILDSRLAAPGSGGGLAATIPPGMRACAIKVDDVVGVAGFVTPGMRVDVVVSGNPPGTIDATQGAVAKTILQNIQVLSAGTDIQKDAEGKPKSVQVVNLLVSPEQAETLSLTASQAVKIQLVLRNPLDTKTDPVLGTAMVNIFGGSTAPAAPKVLEKRKVSKPEADDFSIEVINGSKQSEEKIGSFGGK